ncbi:MAG: PilX N-terminal domain-containing pilus assembly protein [Lautropia sp.]
MNRTEGGARILARIPARERGAALVISLMLLAIVMVLGTAAWQMGTLEERMVGQQRDRAIAFEAAEAALRDGERDILGVCATNVPSCAARSPMINGETGFGVGGAPGTCSSTGLCMPVPGEKPDYTNTVAIAALRATTNPASVQFGTFTRPTSAQWQLKAPNGTAPLPRQPRYVIEVLCFHGGGQGMTSSFVNSCPNPIYRVTAIGWGARQGQPGEATEVILQSYFSLGN